MHERTVSSPTPHRHTPSSHQTSCTLNQVNDRLVKGVDYPNDDLEPSTVPTTPGTRSLHLYHQPHRPYATSGQRTDTKHGRGSREGAGEAAEGVKTLYVSSHTPCTPTCTHASPSPTKNSSGRYGVDVTQSDLSDFSSHSDDSDIEELEGPPPPLVPTVSANLSPLNFIPTPFSGFPSIPPLLASAPEPPSPPSPSVFPTPDLPSHYPCASPFDDTSPHPGSPSQPYSPRGCSFDLYSDGGLNERPRSGYISPIELLTLSDGSVDDDTDSRPVEERPLSHSSSASPAG
jgi:hypothetical protein